MFNPGPPQPHTHMSLNHSPTQSILQENRIPLAASCSQYALPIPSVAPVTTAQSPYCLRHTSGRRRYLHDPPNHVKTGGVPSVFSRREEKGYSHLYTKESMAPKSLKPSKAPTARQSSTPTLARPPPRMIPLTWSIKFPIMLVCFLVFCPLFWRASLAHVRFRSPFLQSRPRRFSRVHSLKATERGQPAEREEHRGSRLQPGGLLGFHTPVVDCAEICCSGVFNGGL